MANLGNARWLANADSKFGYMLPERIEREIKRKGIVSWKSRTFREMKPGHRVLLMQTYGGKTDSLRGI